MLRARFAGGDYMGLRDRTHCLMYIGGTLQLDTTQES